MDSEETSADVNPFSGFKSVAEVPSGIIMGSEVQNGANLLPADGLAMLPPDLRRQPTVFAATTVVIADYLFTKKRKIDESNDDRMYYDMSGKKYLLIFNHMTYQETDHFRNKRPAQREGTNVDVLRLKRVFEEMEYYVEVFYDLSYEKIMEIITKVSLIDHSTTACLCVAILTHSTADNYVYAADRPYNLKDITVKLEKGHQGLVGKPKLFFIQACRGYGTTNVDGGRILQTDGVGGFTKIPATADFLFLRSSVEGYYSYRSAMGSILITELCEVLERHQDKDIHYILTAVNKQVAFKYTILYINNGREYEEKQMTDVEYTLTKLFRFNNP